MAKSTKKTSQAKPQKPRPDFPLFPHATGRWCRKVRGRFHYFGKVAEDPEGKAALDSWLDQRDDLLAGREPRPKTLGLSVDDACNEFLHAKQQKVDSGELALSTFRGYRLTAKQVLKVLGRTRSVEDLRGADFDALRRHFAKTNGLVGLKNKITHTRIIFKYAYDAELIDRPVRFGANFKRPSAQAIRRTRKPRMFEPVEIRKMLDNSGPTLKAMILLGVNCGFGPRDIGLLPQSAVDIKGGWIEYPRPKTGADRRIPLWPETAEALEAALAVRPKPEKKWRHLFFVTAKGRPFEKETTRYLSDRFRKYLEPLGLYQKGRGFYTLRHVLETIGGETRDQVAVDAIMGHERGDADMGSNYRERISDDRRRAVVNVVRDWLFAEPADDDEDQPDVIPFRTVG